MLQNQTQPEKVAKSAQPKIPESMMKYRVCDRQLRPLEHQRASWILEYTHSVALGLFLFYGLLSQTLRLTKKSGGDFSGGQFPVQDDDRPRKT